MFLIPWGYEHSRDENQFITYIIFELKKNLLYTGSGGKFRISWDDNEREKIP